MMFKFNFSTWFRSGRSNLMESLPEGILSLSSEGRITAINSAAAKIIGSTESKAVGKSLYQISPELNRLFYTAGSGGHPEIAAVVQGKKAYYEMSVTALHNNVRTSPGILVVFHDISENKLGQQRLEDSLNEERKLRKQLQDEIDSRGKYTRNIVHELNSPLTAIISSGELLEGMDLGKIPSALVQNIQRAAANLEHSTGELVGLASGETGTLHITSETLEPSVLLNEVVSEISPVAAGKGLKVIPDIPPDLPLIEGEKVRLRQVVMNLLSNAIKFTIAGQITVRARHDSEFLLVQVEDTGRGIEAERLNNLFDPYRRQPSNDIKNSGLGIGLAICKTLVELHHGKIWAESSSGKGSIFSFKIPLAGADQTKNSPAENSVGTAI
jgi:PAS domain S-box-containing protein